MQTRECVAGRIVELCAKNNLFVSQAGVRSRRSPDDNHEYFERKESESGYCDDQKNLRWIEYRPDRIFCCGKVQSGS